MAPSYMSSSYMSSSLSSSSSSSSLSSSFLALEQFTRSLESVVLGLPEYSGSLQSFGEIEKGSGCHSVTTNRLANSTGHTPPPTDRPTDIVKTQQKTEERNQPLLLFRQQDADYIQQVTTKKGPSCRLESNRLASWISLCDMPCMR